MGLRDHLPCDIRSELVVHGRTQSFECRLLDRIGEGGMATVYLAEHEGRRVAVKYLNPEIMLSQDTALDRFVREASLLKGIRHPNIVRIYNLGVDQEDCPFLVMELVERAKTLATLIEVWRFRRSQAGEPDPATGRFRASLVPLGVLLPLMRQVIGALSELHVRGIVHRDIKPDNVLVSDVDGQCVAKLTDLGISKSLVGQDPGLTAENCVVGTPYYMSPEAVTGCRIDTTSGKAWYVGKQSDVWGIGVMLYELVTGCLPYTADIGGLPSASRLQSSQERANLMAAQVVGKVADAKFRHEPLGKYVEDPNRTLAEMIDICLTKEPWLRPQDAETLLPLIGLAEEEERNRGRTSDHSGPCASLPSKLISGVRSKSFGEAPTVASNPPPRLSAEPPMTVRDKADKKPHGTAGKRRMPRWPVAVLALAALAIGALVAYPYVQDVFPWFGQTTVSAPISSPSIVAPATARPLVSAPPRRQPDSGPARSTVAYQVLQQGRAAFRAGDCRTASKHMRAIQAAYPAFPETYRILGDCAHRAGDQAEARENYGRYLEFEGVVPLPPEALKIVNQ